MYYDFSDIFFLFGLKWFQFYFHGPLRSRFECKIVVLFLLLLIQLFHDIQITYIYTKQIFAAFHLR